MTVWKLKCEKCGTVREVDLGFNLNEFEKIYIYCETCGKNTFHRVLGVEEEG